MDGICSAEDTSIQCRALADYAMACSKLGVVLSNWREVVTECGKYHPQKRNPFIVLFSLWVSLFFLFFSTNISANNITGLLETKKERRKKVFDKL